MKVFFHVQHLLGIGHLKRAGTIARALRAAGCEVVLASGGMPVHGIEVSVQLPPLRAADAEFKLLVDAEGRPLDEAGKQRRSAALLDAWHDAQADVLLVELFPFGRRQLGFELLPLLEAAHRRRPRPLVACSVRDLLQPKPGRQEEAVALAERYFDRILVHGDPRLAGLERTFGLADRLAERLHYTGYVVDEAPARLPLTDEVLVSAGGGAVGRRLLETALQARALSELSDAPWRLLAGAQASEDDLQALQRLAPCGVAVERSRDDFRSLLSACSVSVSQAGYNTVVELLQAGARAVLVPFAAGGEAEQTLRARILAERGLAEKVEEASLTPAALAAAIDRAAAKPRRAAGAVDLDGARRSAELLRRWVQ